MSLTNFTTFGSYGYHDFNPVQRFVGRPFFYNDEEVGIGWESKIDAIYMKEDRFGYILELSCGTRVEIDGSEFIKGNYKALFTNMKETND